VARSDPEELTLAAAYADRTLIVSWRPAEPGLAALIAPCGDDAGADQTVRLAQTKDSDGMLGQLRRLVLQLPAAASSESHAGQTHLDARQQPCE
jgi:hypothetical protein